MNRIFNVVLSAYRRGEGETALETSYATEEEIPVEYAKLYTEKDGQFVLTGVRGIKTDADVTRLNSALVKERNDHKQTKALYAPLAGKDINEVVAILDEYPVVKAAASGKIDETKLEAMVTARLAPVIRERDTLKTQVTEKDEKIKTYEVKETRALIKGAIIEAATAAKVQPFAIDDALAAGLNLFTVDEAGNVSAKEGVGITPMISPVDWLSDIAPKKPHWFGTTSGGGAGGGNGGGPSGANPYSHEGWNLSQQAQLYRTNPAKAAQLAKVHGVDPLLPSRPAAKK